MRVHLVNPSDVSFGVAVITPRWLYVLAAATPAQYGTPHLVDETLPQLNLDEVARRRRGRHQHSYRQCASRIRSRERRAGSWRVCRLRRHPRVAVPDEARTHGGAHAVVKGDGELMWPSVLEHCAAGAPLPVYDGGRIPGASLRRGRWDLLPEGGYMWASVQTVRGCPKHCSFCSVWRTDGQEPRARTANDVVEELRDLRRRGFRFVALADDNFYPITKTDLAMAARRLDKSGLKALEDVREERFELMRQLAELPDDMVFYTQITMEAAEDPEFLDAMRKAHIRGALVGVESVTKEGLKSIYKDFNLAGDELIAQLQKFRDHDIHVLASFIFGLPTDTPATFSATASSRRRRGSRSRSSCCCTPFPGTIDFQKWEDSQDEPLARRRRAAHPALAAPAQEAAEDLHPASDDVRRADSRADAGHLGQLLQPAGDLAAVELPSLMEKPADLRADLQACTVRCTRTPASPPTAPGTSARVKWRV